MLGVLGVRGESVSENISVKTENTPLTDPTWIYLMNSSSICVKTIELNIENRAESLLL